MAQGYIWIDKCLIQKLNYQISLSEQRNSIIEDEFSKRMKSLNELYLAKPLEINSDLPVYLSN